MDEFILDEKGNSGQHLIKYKINGECWECTSHTNKNNSYLKIGRNGIKYYMHRYIYLIYHGEIPEDKVVMHKCDNRKCVNPNHFKLGNTKENIHDMINKGRDKLKGEKSGMYGRTKDKNPFYGKEHTKENRKRMADVNKKLNENQLLEIKQLILNGEKNNKISTLYNVSSPTIGFIKNGKSTYTKFLKGGLKEWLENE